MKQLFADIPDEDRRKISALSLKLALIADEKGKLAVQVAGLSSQAAEQARENDALRRQAEAAKQEVNRQRVQLDSMGAKVEVLKATIEDFNAERTAMLKEKERLFGEFTRLKAFIPEYEAMEKSDNRVKHLVSMKERSGRDEFLNYLYTYTMVQIGNHQEMEKKLRDAHIALEQRDITIKSLELSQDELKRQLDAKKKLILKMKEKPEAVFSQPGTKKRKLNEISIPVVK